MFMAEERLSRLSCMFKASRNGSLRLIETPFSDYACHSFENCCDQRSWGLSGGARERPITHTAGDCFNEHDQSDSSIICILLASTCQSMHCGQVAAEADAGFGISCKMLNPRQHAKPFVHSQGIIPAWVFGLAHPVWMLYNTANMYMYSTRLPPPPLARSAADHKHSMRSSPGLASRSITTRPPCLH